MQKKTLIEIFELCLVLCVVMLFTLCSCEKHNHSYESNWCINEDYHFHKCEGCEEITDKEAHTWNDGVVTKEATETADGEKTYTCTVCGKTKIERIIASKGLKFELSDTEDSYIVIGLGTCEDNDIVIPSTYKGLLVTSIGYAAFSRCINLTSITIPNNVTNIGESTFEDCISLTSIIVDKNNKVYDSRENCNAIIETSSNTLIAGCQNTVIPNSVTSIGNYAFDGCRNLTSIIIPNNVTSIGDSSFAFCISLTNITIPNSVTSIGNKAFVGCGNLTSIIVDKNNKIYDSRENCDAIIETSGNELILGCQNTVIPNSVTSIGDSSFALCSNLTSIIIPESVASIGDSAFWGCGNLTSIVIPKNVTSIGDSAFWGCSNLTSIVIPKNVTSIGNSAFWVCSNLTSIIIPESVTSIGDSAFFFCINLTIYCEANSKPDGWDHNWNPDKRLVIWGYKK